MIQGEPYIVLLSKAIIIQMFEVEWTKVAVDTRGAG